jgi:hypothetical protein
LHNVHSYQKPVLPQRVANCEDLNLSQVSIKYSDSLTKDALFIVMVRSLETIHDFVHTTTLIYHCLLFQRDMVRKITECIVNNRSFCLKMTVGKLMAKGKKVNGVNLLIACVF